MFGWQLDIKTVPFDLEKWDAAANTYGEELPKKTVIAYKSAIKRYLNAHLIKSKNGGTYW